MNDNASLSETTSETTQAKVHEGAVNISDQSYWTGHWVSFICILLGVILVLVGRIRNSDAQVTDTASAS